MIDADRRPSAGSPRSTSCAGQDRRSAKKALDYPERMVRHVSGTPSSFRLPRRRILSRSLVAVAAAGLGALLCSPVAGRAQASGLPALNCSAVPLPVAIADPGPADQTMWGSCATGAGRAKHRADPHTWRHLQPSVLGLPVRSRLLLLRRAATAVGTRHLTSTQSGRATVRTPRAPSHLDRGGHGPARRGDGAAFRGGRRHAFTHVMLVGHSFGSIEAWVEAAAYHDVDAVLVTGALHALNPDVSALEADLYPRCSIPSSLAPAWTRATDHGARHTRVAVLQPPPRTRMSWRPTRRIRTP